MSPMQPETLSIPAEVLRIATKLEDAGFETWCVGGAVRDQLLGYQGKDVDLATSATPNQVRRLFRRTIPVGIEHGTVAVLDRDNKPHEVTTFRKDVKTDGRHAEVEFGVSLDEDLARRDFTINAIAYHPLHHEWRDLFGGVDDMEAKVVRAVGDPEQRFREDYLRILRALRFAARFGFEIEAATWHAINSNVAGLQHLSAERVRDEWFRGIAAARSVGEFVGLWRDVGAVDVWLPEAGMAEGRKADKAEGRKADKAEGRKADKAEGRKADKAEGWKAGKAEGWKAGKAEGRKAGMAEGRKADKAEGRKASMAEGRKAGRSEDRYGGKAEDRYAGKAEGRYAGKAEDRKAGKAEDREAGKAEDRKAGMAEDRYAGKAEGRKASMAEDRYAGKAEGRKASMAEDRKAGMAEDRKAGMAEDRYGGMAEGRKAGMAVEREGGRSVGRSGGGSDEQLGSGVVLDGIDRIGLRDPVLITSFLSTDPAETLTRLKCSRAEIERGRRIGWFRGRWPDPESEVAVRKWMAELGEAADDLVWLARVEGASEGLGDAVKRFRMLGAPLSIGDLAVTGDDLIAAGVKKGPMIGKTLRRLLELVVEHPELNTKATLLERARGFMGGSDV